MTIWRSATTPTTATAAPPTCVACRRTGTPTLPTNIDGDTAFLCADPTNCLDASGWQRR